MDMPRRLGAEFFGTFWLTFAGCGSAVLAAGFPALGIGFLGVSSRIWPDSSHNGICSRSYFGRAFQLCRHSWAVGWRSFQGKRSASLHCGAGWRGNCCSSRPLRYCLRQAGLGTRRFCLQWLWRAQSREIWDRVVLPHQSHRNVLFFVRNYWNHFQGGTVVFAGIPIGLCLTLIICF